MATPEAKSLPDTFLIISGVALLVFALSYFIAPGSFDMLTVSDGETVREVIDPDSFVQSESANGLPLFSADGAPALFNAIFEGLASGSRNGGAGAVTAAARATATATRRRRRQGAPGSRPRLRGP